MATLHASKNDWTIADGVLAGIVASIAYTVVAQLIVVSLYGTGAFSTPFRQIAAVAVGTQALSPDYDLMTATILGTAVHLVVGVIYALIFLVIAKVIGITSKSGLIASGAIYGVLIYSLNLFAIFPRWFPWFLENDPFVQVTLHALAFGAVIGWWLSRQQVSS